jgi:hypothetical protein
MTCSGQLHIPYHTHSHFSCSAMCNGQSGTSRAFTWRGGPAMAGLLPSARMAISTAFQTFHKVQQHRTAMGGTRIPTPGALRDTSRDTLPVDASGAAAAPSMMLLLLLRSTPPALMNTSSRGASLNSRGYSAWSQASGLSIGTGAPTNCNASMGCSHHSVTSTVPRPSSTTHTRCRPGLP